MTSPRTPAPSHGASHDPSSVDALEHIPVLPEGWEHSSSRAAERAAERAARRANGTSTPAALQITHPARYFGLWGRYVALFVGAGLISGSVVHYPLDPGRYLLIGAVGAVMFAAASAVHEARANLAGGADLARFIGASLVLALGIGMISGGIQHFSDIPGRAATLIPLGAALSLIAFAVRDGHRIAPDHLQALGVGTAVILLLTAVILGRIASGMPASEGGHAHGDATGAAHDATGASTPAAEHGAAADDAAHGTTPAATQRTVEAAASAHDADGHVHAAGE